MVKNKCISHYLWGWEVQHHLPHIDPSTYFTQESQWQHVQNRTHNLLCSTGGVDPGKPYFKGWLCQYWHQLLSTDLISLLTAVYLECDTLWPCSWYLVLMHTCHIVEIAILSDPQLLESAMKQISLSQTLANL